MTNYMAALKRLFSLKKYPMYRTTKMRYIFLHLLILALILSLMTFITIYRSAEGLTELVNHQSSEIPDFSIDHHELKVEADKTIPLSSGTVSFTNGISAKETDLIAFTKHQLYIKNMNPIDYESINMFTNKDELLNLLKAYTQSSYFFLVLIDLFFLSVQYAVIIIKCMFVAAIGHLLSKGLRRKTRYMNWFKISAFILTLPTLILALDTLNANSLYRVISWCIIALLALMTALNLPADKKRYS